MCTVHGPNPRNATSEHVTSSADAHSRVSSSSPPPPSTWFAGVKARASPRRYSSLRWERPHARMAASSAERIPAGESRAGSASGAATATTRAKMVAAAAPLSCWKTMARARERNARWDSRAAARAAWHSAMRGRMPASATTAESRSSRDVMCAMASATGTSPKCVEGGLKALDASRRAFLAGLVGEGVVGVGGDAGAAIPEALRARFGISVGRFSGVAEGRVCEDEARAGRDARRPGVVETGNKRANARCIHGEGGTRTLEVSPGEDGARRSTSRTFPAPFFVRCSARMGASLRS